MPDPLPGPFGKSWFQLELDTTAPQMALAAPEGAAPGETLTIDYTISEPALIEARLRAPNGALADMDVSDTSFSIPLPAEMPAGDYRVIINAVDTVGNARGYDVTFTIGEATYVPPQSGGFNPFTFTAGPLVGIPFELELEGEIEGVRPVAFAFSGEVAGQGIRRVIVELAGEVYAERMVTLARQGEREPGARMAQLAREDELLLLGLAR